MMSSSNQRMMLRMGRVGCAGIIVRCGTACEYVQIVRCGTVYEYVPTELVHVRYSYSK